MVLQWEPGTQYNLGDVVEYQGHKYKIVQPHMSQGDWTPDRTPALWARLPEQYGGGDQCQGNQQQQSYQPSYSDNKCEEKPWQEQQTQKVDVPEEEQKKHWYDLDDNRKKQLEIGGGLAAGLALMAGGYAAYKHHEKSEEQKKAQVWGLQQWLREAQDRSQDYHANGPRGPVTWVLVHGPNIPPHAIKAGEENGQPIFIARAFHEGSIQVGKACPTLPDGASIGYGHEEISVNTYEVLVGDSRAVHWVSDRGHLNPEKLGARPVEGGRETDGTPLFIARAPYENSTQVGKCSERLDGAFIPYGGTEKKINDYQVLCYN